MLNMLLGPALELGKDFLKGKAEEKKAIQQRKISAIQNDADWENKMRMPRQIRGRTNSGPSSSHCLLLPWRTGLQWITLR